PSRSHPRSQRGRSARGAGRQPLPLHRLLAHLRVGAGRGEGGEAMRGDARSHALVRARDLGEALARVGDGYRPLAGGTDVMVVFAAGKLGWEKLVDVWAVSALRGILVGDAAVELGALTTYTEVQG